jgi:hypothetical protein
MHEQDREKALRVINKSADVCLISNSIKSKVIISPVIKGKDTSVQSNEKSPSHEKKRSSD